MKLRFLGHACSVLEHDGTALIIDPFLKDNPLAPLKPADVKVQFILVTHGHFDHLGDAWEIARQCRATLVSTAEIARLAQDQGINAHAMHIGGKHDFPFGFVRITPAFHGAGVPGGHACGFVVGFFGKHFYFPGDTALFGDMRLIGELERVDVMLPPIGDNFTMGPADAVLAVKMVRPELVIPTHYNTWPLIRQDARRFKELVERETGSSVVILDPGDAHEF
ncbi:MAG: metal-dependent hydrolase [Bacillota bacterium]